MNGKEAGWLQERQVYKTLRWLEETRVLYVVPDTQTTPHFLQKSLLPKEKRWRMAILRARET